MAPIRQEILAASDGLFAIQPAIWPERKVSTQVLPYVGLHGAAGVSLDRGGADFAVGGTLRTDTYFNLFNLGKWRKACGDMPIGLHLAGQGRFHLTVFMASQNQFQARNGNERPARSPIDRKQFADRIFSDSVTLDGILDLRLDTTEADARCILFFELTALSDGRLDDFAWTTPEQPRRNPDLVLSVTTFKREAAVISTMDRFRRFRATSPLGAHIRMVVVDNGESVDATSGDGITLFPNANLGGSGGFCRGLLEVQKTGGTHCLFMDDDASIHMGAITRTWMLLAYARDDRLAVAGAMLDADRRWLIWENGATFDRGCRPMYHGLDLRDPDAVFAMEFDTTASTPPGFYGGWWYFAFPVDNIKALPFPFFVRGDDVSFSLVNDFKCVTLPGVASIQESFIDKASPTTWYLDMRSHLAHHLSLPHKSVGWRGLQRMFLSFYLRTVLRFHYDTLSAVNLAIEDVLRGPQFFVDNADMAQRRSDLKALTQTENWQPTDHPPHPHIGRLRRPMRLLLLVTLNGHLLPFSNMLGSRLAMSAVSRDDFRLMYGAREITFVNAKRSAIYTVRRDRKRFFKESVRFLRNNIRLLRTYKKREQEWQASYRDLTSHAFWHDLLDLQPQVHRDQLATVYETGQA